MAAGSCPRKGITGGELRPGAWLASLEFEIAALVPQGMLDGDDGRRVWLYRAPFRSRG